MTHWEVVDKTVPQFAVAEFDGDEKLHEHPIYFTDRREAERAASRLNVRDHLPSDTCPERITVENMAGLPLDCILRPGHEGPHRDGATGARWVP